MLTGTSPRLRGKNVIGCSVKSRQSDYVKRMLRRALTLISLLATSAALAADTPAATGIVATGPASVLFTIAGLMILGLLFRQTAHRLTQGIVNRIGEMRIQRVLKRHGKDQLHDIIIPGAYGGLARIDHAVLTPGGILCIRTVHTHGVVFGTEDEAQWTNVDGISRRRFLNPLIQNEGRTRALQNIVPEVPVANLVVFTGNVDFPNPLPTNVIHVDSIDSYIAKYVFGPSKVEDWDAVWMSVKSAILSDDASRRDFNAQLSFS